MPNRKKFEYLETVIPVKWELQDPVSKKFKPEKLLVTKLDQLGQEGWELVHIREHPIFADQFLYTAIFKREKIIDDEI
jgi:hypothetical protein